MISHQDTLVRGQQQCLDQQEQSKLTMVQRIRQHLLKELMVINSHHVILQLRAKELTKWDLSAKIKQVRLAFKVDSLKEIAILD